MKKHIIFFAAITCLPCFSGVNRVNAQNPPPMLGDGTSGNPWQITTSAQLASLPINTNGYFKLMNDLDLSVYAAGAGWDPIGSDAFYGNFDGNGKVIRNLTINRSAPYPYTYIWSVGLFGNVMGNIVNLGIENCNVSGGVWVGGLVGTCQGTISNCYVTGSVRGDGVSGGTGGSIGGLVGNLIGNMSNCYFSGSLFFTRDMGNHAAVGGLVGVTNGYLYGDDNNLTSTNIYNCYVKSKITTQGNNYTECSGGLVGVIRNTSVFNCIVASDSIITDNPASVLIRRIVTINQGGILKNNYALNTMVKLYSGGNEPITSGLDLLDGLSIPMDSLQSFTFYNSAINWYGGAWNIAPPSGTWKICDGQDLPFLRWQGIDCYYDITTLADSNGSISPSDTVSVLENANQTFILTPNICYETDSLWIDGVYSPDSIAAGSYTFENVTKNHTIEVSFKRLPPDTVIIKDTICYGTDYVQNGFNILNAETDSVYFNNDLNTNGCDSVTKLELSLNLVYFTQINESICEGDFYDFYGNLLTEDGIYYDTFQTIHGCDSVIELTLTITPIDTTQILENICVGDSYDFFGRTLTEDGIYYETLQTVHGCDSVIELILTTDVGINEWRIENGELRIYPNPTSGKLQVTSYELQENSVVEIYDVVGQCVFTSPCPSKGGEYSTSAQFPSFGGVGVVIDVSHLASGMYFLKVGNRVVKFIKK